MNLSRRTELIINISNTDISADINKYFINAVYTEHSEDKADDLRLELDDRDSHWISWLTGMKGAVISCVIVQRNWNGDGGVTSATTSCNTAGTNHGYSMNMRNRGNILCSSKYFKSSAPASDVVAMSFELQQSPTSFRLNQMNTNEEARTNHGYLVLAPTNTTTATNVGNGMVFAGGQNVRVGLAGSSDKANNSPTPIRCTATGFESVREDATNYVCDTYIKLPNPVGSGVRNEQMSFISLSLPGAENATDFEISYYGNDAFGNPGDLMIMGETQYEVFVQGQAGDRVRRIRSYIGGITNGLHDIVPKWSASTTGAGIVKCGSNASQAAGNCNGSGGYVEAEISESWRNTTDYVICRHDYWTKTSYNDNTFDPVGRNPNRTPNSNASGLWRCAIDSSTTVPTPAGHRPAFN